MKVTKWVTIIATIVFGQTGLWATVAGASDTKPPKGVISYWTFDDGTATDVVGSNDGTVYGAVPAPGMVGQSMFFDGYSTIHMPNTPVFGSGDFTVAFWGKDVEPLSGVEGIFSTTEGYPWTQVVLYGGDWAGIDTLYTQLPSESVCAADAFSRTEWSFIVLRRSGDVFEWIINGALNATCYEWLIDAPWDSTHPELGMNIGSSRPSYLEEPLTGYVDELAFFNRAVTNAEIQEFYQNGLAGRGYEWTGGDIKAHVPRGVHSSLVAYWPLNEGIGTSASDVSGNGHDGIIFGASWTSDSAPLAAVESASIVNPAALLFDGEDDVVAVTDSSDLNPQTAFTVAVWVKADPTQISPDGHWGIVDKSHGSTGWDGWVMQGVPNGLPELDGMNRAPNPGEVIFAFGIGWSFIHIGTVASMQDGAFHHVAATWDGVSMNMYVDGVLKETVHFSGPVVGNDLPLFIGSTAFWSPFRGVVDDLRIYDIALSVGQVNALAHGGSVGIGR